MICSVAKYEASLGPESEPITAGCARISRMTGEHHPHRAEAASADEECEE